MADWVEMWNKKITPWHNDKVVNALKKYIEELTGRDKQARILLPLCGKSVDMKWLADQGYTVIGVELAEAAAEQFFDEQNIKCTHHKFKDDVIIYEGVDVKIRFVIGDFLCCTSEMCGGKVDGIWDINSIVAMPMKNWNRYVDTSLSLLKPKKRILLSTTVYDEAERGPEPKMPYSVPTEKVKQLYGDRCDVQHLEDYDFLYFIKEDLQKSEGWTPSRLDQSVHLITLKN